MSSSSGNDDGDYPFWLCLYPEQLQILVECINKKTFIGYICLKSYIISRRCKFLIYKVQGIKGAYVE